MNKIEEYNDLKLVYEFPDDFVDSDVITEAVYPESLPYLYMVTRKINLPKGDPAGNGNLCFLYTHNVNESFQLINSKENVCAMHQYKLYYYSPYYQGVIAKKRYRFRLHEKRKEIHKSLIKSNPTVRPYQKMRIEHVSTKNMYFDMSKYLEIFFDITKKLQPMRFISAYWSYLKYIYNTPANGYTHRFVLVNIDMYPLTKVLSENLRNPMFVIYYTMWKYPDLLKDLDIDFYFFHKTKIVKINPSLMDKKRNDHIKLLQQIKRIYSTIPNMKNIVDDVVDEKNIISGEQIANTVGSIKDKIQNTDNEVPYEKNEDTDTPQIEDHTKNAEVQVSIDKKIEQKVIQATKELSNASTEEVATSDIQKRAEELIDEDDELLTSIYQQNIKPLAPKNTASTARDKLLLEEQEKIKVGNLTVKELEKLKVGKIEIPTTDISGSVRTTNKNMLQNRFNNFEKTYNDKVMKKDLTNAILSLNNKSLPMFIRDIKVEDTSDELNYKDTYTIHLEDSNRKRHTIKVDIPKFLEDKFLYIGGNKKVIKKQNFFYPVVKTGMDTVQIVTNYNKMFIYRVDNKSLASIERFKKLLKKSDKFKNYFKFGNSLLLNKDVITTLEYDELSKTILSFTSGRMKLFFNQGDADEYLKKYNIAKIKGSLFIGVTKSGEPIYINEKTQKTKDNKTIIDLILEAVPEDIVSMYRTMPSPKGLMYAKAKVMSKYMPIGILLGFWEGLTTILKKMNVEYRLVDSTPKDLGPSESFIKFKDTFMVYKTDPKSDLILNGFRLLDTTEYEIMSYDSLTPYVPYLTKIYGKASIGNALINVYECIIDPITLEIIRDLSLPEDIVSLIIYAISLLTDSQYTNEIDQRISRIRSNEIVPAILYERLSKNYINYRNSNGRKKFSIPQDSVIKELLALKTVEDYSTLNPTLELEMLHGVSTKGFRGVNLDDSYTPEKRTYDKSMTGVICPSSSPDATVGVNKFLTMEPAIKSLRGYIDVKEQTNGLTDVNVFSPGELSIPLGATIDDPTRLGHAIKQSKHVIPVKDSAPVLISNGMEEVCRFQLSSDFVVNADESGEIVAYDDETKVMIAKYKSGKCRAINLGKSIVKNGGGGFFLSNQLITELKVGDKFKKNDVLAYHKDFFTNDKFNNCRMNMGTLTKVAIMSTYNTYQDATMITEKLADQAATEMCFLRQVTIGKNSNVQYMVNVGDTITVGDSLIQFDTSYEDNSLNTLLASLSEQDKEDVLADSKNDIHSKYSGVIEDIKMYSVVELDELSPSLRKIFSKYYKKIDKKKKFLEEYDPESKGSIVKCGMLVNETNKKIDSNKFGVIKGQKVEDGVLIEFYIKHSEPLEIGSKIANFTALKNTIGEIIPSGYEPWSEYRPEEEVSTIIASNSILKRMTPSILLTALGNKCVIELKNQLRDIFYE